MPGISKNTLRRTRILFASIIQELLKPKTIIDIKFILIHSNYVFPLKVYVRLQKIENPARMTMHKGYSLEVIHQTFIWHRGFHAVQETIEFRSQNICLFTLIKIWYSSIVLYFEIERLNDDENINNAPKVNNIPYICLHTDCICIGLNSKVCATNLINICAHRI